MVIDEIKNALDSLLLENAHGCFSVIGVKNRKNDAIAIEKRPQVTTYYQSGDFPRNGSAISGPFGHNATFRIDILVAAVSAADVDIINNPDSTDADRANAIQASTDAQSRADELFDTVRGLIFDIIMRPENHDLGLGWNPNRWITGISKDSPSTRGSIVMILGYMTMTATAQEIPTEEKGTDGSIIDTIIRLTGEKSGEQFDSAVQGVEVNNG